MQKNTHTHTHTHTHSRYTKDTKESKHIATKKIIRPQERQKEENYKNRKRLTKHQ